MNRSNDLRSQSLDLLRFPLAVVVLTIHTVNSNGFSMHGKKISIDEFPILMEMNHFVDGFLRGQSVPIYFFISGFVFFLGIELTREKYIQKLRNRVKSLLIPYIIWNIIGVLKVSIMFIPCLSSIFPNAYKIQLDFSLSAILETFWDASKGIFIYPLNEDVTTNNISPEVGPLWFIRDLMIVVLCAPLLYWILKRTRFYFVMLLGILWFVSNDEVRHLDQLLSAFFFFSWGAYMSINKKDMLQVFGRFFKVSVIAYVLLGISHITMAHYYPEACPIIKKMNVFAGLLFAYNLSAWLLKNKICTVNPFLAASSFFIYVSHRLICSDIPKILFMLFHPTSDIGMLLMFLSGILFTVFLLLSVFYLMRRYVPSVLKVVAGRR